MPRSNLLKILTNLSLIKTLFIISISQTRNQRQKQLGTNESPKLVRVQTQPGSRRTADTLFEVLGINLNAGSAAGGPALCFSICKVPFPSAWDWDLEHSKAASEQVIVPSALKTQADQTRKSTESSHPISAFLSPTLLLSSLGSLLKLNA